MSSSGAWLTCPDAVRTGGSRGATTVRAWRSRIFIGSLASTGSFDLGPRVPQTHGAVEDGAPGGVVLPVGDEVALALELHARLRRDRRERGLDLGAAEDFERALIQRGLEVLLLVGLGRGEERVVEPDLGVHRVLGGDPVDRALHLAAPGIPAAARRVVRAAHLGDRAVGGLAEAGALDDVGIAQADLRARRETEVLRRRRLAEVVVLDVQHAGERHRATAGGGV